VRFSHSRRKSWLIAAGRVRSERLCLSSRADRVQMRYRSTSGVRGSGGRVDDFASFVITAVWAGLMRLLHLMAIGTFGERRRFQMVVRAPLVLAPVRVTSFRIGHTNSFSRHAGDGCILCRLPARRLMLLLPVLLDSPEHSQAGIHGVCFAAAIFTVQIRAAART